MVQFPDADVATKGEQAGMLLSLFIPFVLAIWTASAAVQPAIDMTVGERERGTLESLLSLPLTRTELCLESGSQSYRLLLLVLRYKSLDYCLVSHILQVTSSMYHHSVLLLSSFWHWQLDSTER